MNTEKLRIGSLFDESESDPNEEWRPVLGYEMNKNQMKPILQFSQDGDFIAKHDGVSEAARDVGVLASHICCCLKGRRKTCGGYQWKYA